MEQHRAQTETDDEHHQRLKPFRIADSMRDEWTIAVGQQDYWLLDSNKAPTGETTAIESLFPDPKVIPLKDYTWTMGSGSWSETRPAGRW